jgi:hypothetical protein
MAALVLDHTSLPVNVHVEPVVVRIVPQALLLPHLVLLSRAPNSWSTRSTSDRCGGGSSVDALRRRGYLKTLA